jgi:hypothetical protein
MRYRILSHVSAAVFGLALFGVLSLIYEPGPIEKYSRVVYPPEVRGGDTLTITSTVVRSKECTSLVVRRFTDASGRVVEFVPFEAIALPVGTERFEAKVVVPEGLSPGPLIYQVKVNFRCNPIQELFGGTWFVLPDVHLEYLAP